MKLIVSFFRLIRWPNLVFIALTLILFEYCIVEPIFRAAGVAILIGNDRFWLVLLSYLFIAAGGYMINDYFDLNIDLVNKPKKVVVAQSVGRRWVIFWHVLLSLIVVGICFHLSKTTGVWPILYASLVNIFLLFVYSTTFKKKFLIGNVLIAGVIAWGVAMLTFYSYPTLVASHIGRSHSSKLLKLTYLYTGFSFIITLIREVVKDMEDIEGDIRYGCHTMPVVWGLNVTKTYTAVWMVVLMGCIGLTELYILVTGWDLANRWTCFLSLFYSVVFLLWPLYLCLKKLFTANLPKDFHEISTIIKAIMFAGILSMGFFWF